MKNVYIRHLMWITRVMWLTQYDIALQQPAFLHHTAGLVLWCSPCICATLNFCIQFLVERSDGDAMSMILYTTEIIQKRAKGHLGEHSVMLRMLDWQEMVALETLAQCTQPEDEKGRNWAVEESIRRMLENTCRLIWNAQGKISDIILKRAIDYLWNVSITDRTQRCTVYWKRCLGFAFYPCTCDVSQWFSFGAIDRLLVSNYCKLVSLRFTICICDLSWQSCALKHSK